MSLFHSGPTKIAFGFGLGVMTAGMMKAVPPAFRGVILARDGNVKYAEFRETLADVTAEVEAELAQTPPEMQLHKPFAAAPKQNAELM